MITPHKRTVIPSGSEGIWVLPDFRIAMVQAKPRFPDEMAVKQIIVSWPEFLQVPELHWAW